VNPAAAQLRLLANRSTFAAAHQEEYEQYRGCDQKNR